jgi:hypothetical protein
MDNVYNPAVMDFKLYPCRAIADISGGFQQPAYNALGFLPYLVISHGAALGLLSGQAIYPARLF